MTKLTMCAMAALVLGCGGKKDPNSNTGAPEPKDDSALPAEVAGWMSKDAAQAWQGAWVTRLSLSRMMHTGSDYAALDIKDDGAKAFDGKQEYPLGFTIDTPCTATFSQAITEGSMKGGTSFHTKQFVIKGGKLAAGEGAAGMRKGKTAVACSISDKVTTLDDKGACKTWTERFGKWESKDQKCAWSSDGGKDVLTIGDGTWSHKLIADGDLLMDDQFSDQLAKGKHARADSYDAAKAAVTAKLKENDPGEQAKAAGGKVGDTGSVLGLIATFAADPKPLEGKTIEVTGQYYSTGSVTSNGKTTVSLILIADKESSKLTVTCDTTESDMKALSFTQYDKVTAKGVVKESFGKPSLADCTATAAK